jgi:hypothetical protein
MTFGKAIETPPRRLTAGFRRYRKTGAEYVLGPASAPSASTKKTRVVRRCRQYSSGAVAGFTGVFGREFGDRAGYPLAQQDCGDHPAHDSDNQRNP